MMKYIQCVQNANKNVTPQQTIYAIKNAGFDGAFIQWYNKDWEFSQQEQLNLCKQLGLEIPFFHLGYKGINNIWLEGEDGEGLVDGYFKDLEICKENNINVVVMHLTSKFVAPNPNLIGIERLQRIVDYAEKLGIKIAFENTKIFGYLEYVFDHIKNENIGICYDSGHCHCHFDDKFDWEKFKNKIFAVHLHNNDKSDDLHLLPFDKIGTIDWKKVMQNLKNAGFDGPIVLESCYRNHYEMQSIESFYKESFNQALELGKLLK